MSPKNNKDYKSAYYLNNKERLLLKAAAYRLANQEKIVAYRRGITKEKQAEYRSNQDKEAKKLYMVKYREDNNIAIREYNREYNKRKKNSISRRLASRLRKRLIRAVESEAKSGSAVRDLGCSIEFLKDYLASKFQPGMSWDNWGTKGWHIDHIVPLASFDLTDREQFLEACNYKNLQPLWAIDNLAKGSKVA